MNRNPMLSVASYVTWKRLGTASALCVVAATGCAHAPPQELLDARAAYQEASHGIAKQENPAELHTAGDALKSAEHSFDENGNNEHTRDLSYVAMRKAQLTEVQARVQQDEDRLTQLKASMTQEQREDLEKLRGKYQTQQQQLATSQEALAEAKQRAAQATADLARIASVKEDARGTVITLSGEVLFTSGQHELLPSAQAKLSEVATALTQQDKRSPIVVEGHTDSQGSKDFNLNLSRQRAQAVRDYLTSHGVAADRVQAEGFGSAQPVGDNGTPQGRANNRRVEIVVKPAAGA